MDISSITIGENIAFSFENAVVHPEINIVKSLDKLSVVQSVYGSYSISLDNGEKFETGEGGVFIAPSKVTQHINENPGTDGTMTAQWVFLDAEVNKLGKLDELFSFPVILPPRYNQRIFELISSARGADVFSKRLPFISEIITVLLEVATPIKERSELSHKVHDFMEANFGRNISAEELCGLMGCSRSAMYQRFKELTGSSPSKYINGLRIRQSQSLLIKTDMSVAEIASAVGINDQFYFSRLFRLMTGTSATEYRKIHKVRDLS